MVRLSAGEKGAKEIARRSKEKSSAGLRPVSIRRVFRASWREASFQSGRLSSFLMEVSRRESRVISEGIFLMNLFSVIILGAISGLRKK